MVIHFGIKLLYYANRNTTSSPFISPVAINLPGYAPTTFVFGASLNAAQDELFLSLYYSLTKGSEIVEFSRTSSTTFSYVRTLTAPVGYSTGEGQLSKDELIYSFSASFNGGNSLLYQVNRTNPTDTFNLNLLQQIQGINDTTILSNILSSMTDSLKWIVFVRNNSGFWQGDDLYIAHQDITSAVFNQDAKAISVSIFPNPASGQFTIMFNKVIGKGIIEISNAIGENVFKENIINELKKEINLYNTPSGIYFLKLSYEGKSKTLKIVKY